MPVSVVCESTANVNAALRESLGVGSCSSASADVAKTGTTPLVCGGGIDDSDSLQSKLVASAKRVLLSKIEYEEVSNYNLAVLDTLKSKYMVIKPQCGKNIENRRDSQNITCSSKSKVCANGFNDSSAADANGSSIPGGAIISTTTKQQQQQRSQNQNELPTPKRILYPRDNIRIGWKNTQRKWNVGVGMMNVGNTCYLNSTLQALFHVPALANWLMSDTAHLDRCDSADAGCIICAMAKTLQASQTNTSAIRPYLVYSKLKLICKHLVMGRQEDAHEFLRYLVEAMEKSYLSRFRNFKELDQHSKETTPLNQILGGYLRSAVRCLACSHVSVTFQHFEDLLLDIRKADSIEDALEGYFSRERLEDMGYKCEACKKKVSATKQFSLERAPIVLCIQLKRFSMLGTKLNKQITIKPRLELTKFASRKTPGEQLTYKLVSMVTHLGASQHCGHYTAIGLTESGTYYNYDDSYVRAISVQNVCSTNAYIIFYEIDNANSNIMRAQTVPTCTQVSGNSAVKENGLRLTNGHLANKTPIRVIGPQLPPTGLASYTSPLAQTNMTNNTNGKVTTYANGSKLTINRQGSAPTSNNSNGNSKIMIHFKNNNSSNNNGNTNRMTTNTMQTVLPKNNENKQQNGLLAGTGKFQESANPKPPLVSTSNKGQNTSISNGNQSSSSDHSDDDIEVTSTSTQCERKLISPSAPSTLPSMPKLFGHNGVLSNGSTIINKKTQIPSTTTTTTTTKTTMIPSIKSLVPYESATDDEESLTTTPIIETYAKRIENYLKRRSSVSPSDHSDDDRRENSTNGFQLKKIALNSLYEEEVQPTPAPQITTTSSPAAFLKINKQKTDTIDAIFDVKKRNGHSPTKKIQQPQQKSQSQQLVTSTIDSDEETRPSTPTNGSENGWRSFKRAQSTPPSPPVVKTKTGIWQVTTEPPKQSKNPKNPFTTKTTDLNNLKRSKFNVTKTEKPPRIGNGYQNDAANDKAVNELMKQSHRGYGAPVLTWNGNQTEIEKEIIAEARENRQREWDDEEDNEMDRGRQRKIKISKESSTSHQRTPGYNPFQEHENQKRWHKSGGSHHRLNIGHHRHHFQRSNSMKFNRYHKKFQQQRAGHRNAATHNASAFNGRRQQET